MEQPPKQAKERLILNPVDQQHPIRADFMVTVPETVQPQPLFIDKGA